MHWICLSWCNFHFFSKNYLYPSAAAGLPAGAMAAHIRKTKDVVAALEWLADINASQVLEASRMLSVPGRACLLSSVSPSLTPAAVVTVLPCDLPLF